MANEIPPFLPASPPPMCKLDFDEDDDEDEFGDFSNASESCYHDNVSVSKATSDGESNNVKPVFDPRTLYIERAPNHQNPLKNDFMSVGVKDNFTDNYEKSSRADIPIRKLSLENESDSEINVFNSTERCHSDSLDESESHVPVDSTAENTVHSFETDLNSAVANCNGINVDINSNEEDNSIDDSVITNGDKNSATNHDNIDIHFDKHAVEHDENLSTFVTTTNGIENESSPESSSLENIEKVTKSDDTFTTFFSATEIKENEDSNVLNVVPATSVSTESNIFQRAMSEDSDDSNVPDIDFSCFITCPNNIQNEDTDDDFGDFAKPPELNFFDKTPINDLPLSPSNVALDLKSDGQIRPDELNAIPQVTIDEVPIECSNDADDDFADFVSTNCQPPIRDNEDNNDDEFEPFGDYYSKSESSQIAIQNDPSFFAHERLHPSVDLAKTYDLDMECWNEVFQVKAEEQIEVNLNTFEGKLNGSSVWCNIKEIESSPALTYNWNNSETQKILLSALYVDSRNILFGPRWNSEVPRFASNLGFSPLVPQKALDKKDDQPSESIPKPSPENTSLIDGSIISHVPGSVPEAHFDWNNSGLTNPLDSYSHSSLLDLDLLASFDIHSPYYKKNRKNEKKKSSDLNSTSYENSLFAKATHRENMSEEAKEVLNNLPNLYVMEKQYIVFPVS